MIKNSKTKDVFDNDRKKAIGDILYDLRSQMGCTQKDIARYLHMSDGVVSHYENATTVPSIEVIVRLAHYYDVTTDYLLNNCTSKINFSKVLNRNITKEMTIGKAVDIIMNASPSEKTLIAGLLNLIDSKKE
ncbi:MAG: helix-turn-helix domain-containing protein [Oscillospiraceae bacterium]